MDKAKINEQNKSIVVGPFYIGTYFEPIWTLLPEDVAVLNPTGYRTLKHRYPACVRHQNGFSHIVMVWYVVTLPGQHRKSGSVPDGRQVWDVYYLV